MYIYIYICVCVCNANVYSEFTSNARSLYRYIDINLYRDIIVIYKYIILRKRTMRIQRINI